MNTIVVNFVLQKKAAILILLTSIFFSTYLNADTGRYRVMFGNNPSTEMTIGFDAYTTGTNPILYYSTSPIDINNLQSYKSKRPNKVVEFHGMINCFVQLNNLTPEQTYYFVIKDNSGTSEVYNFETIADNNNTRLSIIGGGDSRDNWDIRAMANEIIAKLNAHAVMFDGDFINDGNVASQWQRWLDDWQLTINSNNRITPIIPARGNHENNNTMLVNIFDCAENIYYSKTLADDLLQIYTLNSEIPANGASEQTNWLEQELANSNSIWKFAQYHKPMRPHVSQKKEGSIQYAYWSDLFYQYGVDAVLEGDSHTAKTTWPIIPCSGGFDCDEGFKRDDNNGTVYLGEGAFASPLRETNDVKSWTRDSGTFYQFKWIFVDKNKMEVRTVKYGNNTNTNSINELSTADRFTVPNNLEIWNPSNGDVVTLLKETTNPTCTLTMPCDNELLFDLNEIQLSANASGTSPITAVQFYVNGTLIGTDNNTPYQANWKPSANGVYLLSAIAKDENGLSSNFDFSVVNIGLRNNIVHSASIDIGTDECFEYEFFKTLSIPFDIIKGYVAVNKSELLIADPEVSLQGLRFKEINIPPYAIIESAYITLNPTTGNGLANATIWCENSANSLPFVPVPFNLTDRQKSTNAVEWNNIAPWNSSTPKADATSPDLTTLIQDLIQHPDWSIESPITFLINGSGERRASSFISLINTDYSLAPRLTVQFSVPDCVGLPCDDGNPGTINSRLDENCECVIKGCTDVKACNFNSEANRDDGSCVFPIITCDDGNPLTENDRLDDDCNCIGEPICNDPEACNYNPDPTIDDNKLCTYPLRLCSDGDRQTVNDKMDEDCNCIGDLLGCMDDSACNFNPEAKVDDKSCVFPGKLCSDGIRETVNDRLDENCDCVGEIFGCKDKNACNYNPDAVVNSLCIFPEMLCDDGNPLTVNDKLDEDCKCIGDTIVGCKDKNACNYNPMATIDDNSCLFLDIGNITLNPIDRTSVNIEWDVESFATCKLLFRRLGESNFKPHISEETSINFDLAECTTYEFALEMTCQNRGISEIGEIINYTTSECKEEISNEQALFVYPQPVTNFITIKLAGDSKADLISIYNNEGKVVINQNGISFDGEVYKTNVQHLPAGIYMVSAIKDKYKVTKKVLIQ